MAAASAFFEQGAVGYSPGAHGYEGLRLHAYRWQVRPLAVDKVQSSFFEDTTRFPVGSIQFDNALLMKNRERIAQLGCQAASSRYVRRLNAVVRAIPMEKKVVYGSRPQLITRLVISWGFVGMSLWIKY
ncbi:hypothetical protein [Hymenobacter nivis]|uniref:Uncharacterized protein n=1 Tax=Hymenobacter nivis TaxID=1850093 RepID=A0A2Z3GK76_9BACT|nr:hypothetical protein [Hymenobacter nivis]AWM32107.1 hypothetical protein DDQ68_04430 [Hymenobacter nivis]